MRRERRTGRIDQRSNLAIGIVDEADPRSTLGHVVRRALRLDAVTVLQRRDGRVEVVDADGDVPVPGAQLVRAAVVVVVGRLELAVSDDVRVAREAKAERLVEATAPLGIGDSTMVCRKVAM